MSFEPISFLENVERIFSAATALSDVKTWTRPTKLSSLVHSPEVAIEMVAGNIDSVSLSHPNKQIEFYIRFVIFEGRAVALPRLGQFFWDYWNGQGKSRSKEQIRI